MVRPVSERPAGSRRSGADRGGGQRKDRRHHHRAAGQRQRAGSLGQQRPPRRRWRAPARSRVRPGRPATGRRRGSPAGGRRSTTAWISPLPAMKATAAVLGGAPATSTSAGGVSTPPPSTDASHTNAMPPPGAVLASRFQSAWAPAATQHQRERRGGHALRWRRAPGEGGQALGLVPVDLVPGAAGPCGPVGELPGALGHLHRRAGAAARCTPRQASTQSARPSQRARLHAHLVPDAPQRSSRARYSSWPR